MSDSNTVYKKTILRGGLFSGSLYIYTSLDSTNDHLKKEAVHHKHGDVIQALSQTSGKGRHGRKWLSQPNKDLLFSILLEVKESQRTTLGHAIALGIVQYLKKKKVSSTIKWPNDVLVNFKKISGILVENVNDLCIVGVGININSKPKKSDFRYPVTSFVSEKGVPLELGNTLHELLAEIESVLIVFFDQSFQGILEAWKKHAAFLNRERIWKNGQQQSRVIVKDINAEGMLMIEKDGKGKWVNVGELLI